MVDTGDLKSPGRNPVPVRVRPRAYCYTVIYVLLHILLTDSVVIFYTPNDPEGAGGSGTLVNYKGIKGILTASHVAASLRDKTLYLPCVLRYGTDNIWDVREVSFLRILTIDKLNKYSPNDYWPENRLDISLIQFDDTEFDNIIKQWKKQPVDLAMMKVKYNSNENKYWSPDNNHFFVWDISGVPRQGSQFESENVVYFPFGVSISAVA